MEPNFCISSFHTPRMTLSFYISPGLSCLRHFPGRYIRLLGARFTAASSLGSDAIPWALWRPFCVPRFKHLGFSSRAEACDSSTQKFHTPWSSYWMIVILLTLLLDFGGPLNSLSPVFRDSFRLQPFLSHFALWSQIISKFISFYFPFVLARSVIRLTNGFSYFQWSVMVEESKNLSGKGEVISGPPFKSQCDTADTMPRQGVTECTL